MFHCNGWCFPWTMARTPAPTSACAGSRRRRSSMRSATHKVTHYVRRADRHATLINAPEELRRGITHRSTAWSPPRRRRLRSSRAMERIGFDITHVYGLTETYGPAAVCAKHAEWAALDIGPPRRAQRPAGRALTVQEGMTVMDPETMAPVPCGRRDDGRDHVPRQHHDEGLSQEPGGDRGGVRRRLVPFRRSGGHAAGRLRQDPGPLEGRHHLRRREHLLARGRGRAVSPSGGARAPRWSRSRTRNGAKRRARSSS